MTACTAEALSFQQGHTSANTQARTHVTSREQQDVKERARDTQKIKARQINKRMKEKTNIKLM